MMGAPIMFVVRIVDVEREIGTIVCERCGTELPIGALNLIDAGAFGAVMLEHERKHRTS